MFVYLSAIQKPLGQLFNNHIIKSYDLFVFLEVEKSREIIFKKKKKQKREREKNVINGLRLAVGRLLKTTTTTIRSSTLSL